jgi:hypothetical protein
VIITTPVRIPWSRGPTYDIDRGQQPCADGTRQCARFEGVHKLDISSRKQLCRALNGRGSHSP